VVDRVEQDDHAPRPHGPRDRRSRPARPNGNPPRGLRPDLVTESPGDAIATLLPALDPTPMGWKNRDWFLGIDPRHVFDRAGNIGPTLWWNGEIIGSWAIAPDGELRTKAIADRGAEAHAAIERAASRLHARLDGAVVTPAIRVPLDQSLTRADGESPT
jgi:hypothetical protein